MQEFFPAAWTKKNYEIPQLAGQEGYTSFGKEHAKGGKPRPERIFPVRPDSPR